LPEHLTDSELRLTALKGARSRCAGGSRAVPHLPPGAAPTSWRSANGSGSRPASVR